MNYKKMLAALLTAPWTLAFLSAQVAPQGFRVYISADMEGIAGIVDGSQTSSSGRDYALARKFMTEEVNAAVRACYAAGAAEVWVNDSHGGQTNLQPDQLDPRVVLITGQPKPLGMMQGIDDSFAAAIFIGYHARASTVDGILDHTYNGQIKSVRLNGREVGEYGLSGSLAGHFGVPVVFLSGDAAVAAQAQEFMPGIETLSVKQAIGQHAARTLHPDVAREKIGSGIRAALSRRTQIEPVRLSRPVTIEMELATSGQADAAEMVPGMKRVSGRVVSYVAPDMVTAYRISRLVARLASN